MAGSIHRACASGRIISTIRYLLTSPGCNVPNQEGHTPMFLAVNNNQPLVLSVLLEAGISVCDTDFQGSTLLHLVAYRFGKMRICLGGLLIN